MVKIRTKKKLGQHFLNNEEISKKIVIGVSNLKKQFASLINLKDYERVALAPLTI